VGGSRTPPLARVIVEGDGGASAVEITAEGARVEGLAAPARVSRVAPAEYRVAIGERTFTVFAVADRDRWWVFVDGRVHRLVVRDERQPVRPAGGYHEAVVAPMPATVVRILVAPGARVARGDTLILLDAMKMELPLRSPRAGVVRTIACREGELVQPDVLLIDIEPQE
jgi:3-methylcrotonyl-CoA carboxylase alpha subunit